MDSSSKKLHIAMFPWLAYGHVMPFFQLSKFLAEKGHRISFISTPKNLNRVSDKIPEELSKLLTLVPITLPRVAGLPEGSESTADLPADKVPFLKKAFDSLEPGLAGLIIGVSLIIHDFPSHWLRRVTAPLGVRSIFFSIFNATTLLFAGSPAELLSGSRVKPEDFAVAPPWMMTGGDAVAYKPYEIASLWGSMDDEISDFQRFAEVIRDAEAVLVKTCPEFESDSLARLEVLYGKPVLPVGVLPMPTPKEPAHGSRFETLRAWLDDKGPGSVVYIALGTELGLTFESTRELAEGMEKTGLPFVWVVNQRDSGSEVIKEVIESRVSERGLVWKGWAPQIEILAHPAVGGFLTHCGWSSVTEGLALGRPLILFPGGSSDLGLVARLLSSRGVGLEVPRDDDTGWFGSDSLASAIRRVVVDPEGEAIRSKAMAMRKIFGDLELHNKHLDKVAQFVVNNVL